MVRLTLVLAVLAVTLLTPSIAVAAPIRECNMAWDGTRWYYGSDGAKIQGYRANNFTTRVATCTTARKVFRATNRIKANSCLLYTSPSPRDS